MCGIAGIFSYDDSAPPVDDAELRKIRDRMASRGPDGSGAWIAPDGRIGLAHRRLAILDLSLAGQQPMVSADERYVITFNGEVYNFRQLRLDLQSAGVRFRSQSDTEVLLELVALEGVNALARLRGMFAMAIWDREEQSLLLARDQFGIKPLYIHDDGRALRFASQVKALVAGGAVPPAIDQESEESFWIWGHVPEPATIFRNVRALEPGRWLRLERRGRRMTGLFDSVESILRNTSDGDSPPSLRSALQDSVRSHLVSDVPVGIFLSAGIDSSALVGHVTELGHRPRTLTIGFEEFRGTRLDETPLAEEVARTYRTEHSTVWIGRRDFEDALGKILDAMDQPTIDGVNTWIVSRAASRLGLKVALSGLGSDELFGGYPSFVRLPHIRRIARLFRAMPSFGRRVRQVLAPCCSNAFHRKLASIIEYGGTWPEAYMLQRAVRLPWQVSSTFVPALPSVPNSADAHTVVSYLELTQYMRNQLLRDSDWASMAHSLELRVPYVDKVLARLVSAGRKQGADSTKRAVANTVRPPLPIQVSTRPKTGFGVPVREWLLAADESRRSNSASGGTDWQSIVLESFGGSDRSLEVR